MLSPFLRCCLVALIASVFSNSAVAFTFHPQKKTVQKTTTTRHYYSSELIKKSGGGVPLQPPGDRYLFDPNEAGRLGGTDNLNRRLSQGYQFLSPSVAVVVPDTLDDAQHYLEDSDLPPVFAKATQPVTATVLARGRLIGEDAEGDIQHIVLQLPEGFRYVEGQSLSVIPPVSSGQKPHKPRLYSIASTRYGDLLDGRTVSLCVRRALYYDPVTKLPDPTKAGVCSNFLCDTQVGDTVPVAGPVGKTMLLPNDPNKDLIMVATGTGIAPFRGFLHRLFVENTVARHMFNGHAWLILGVPTSSNLLYHDELEYMQPNPQLEVTYAISREMSNAQDGGKLYVQHVLAERSAELFEKLDNGAVIYFCGLSGMMPGILEALEQVAASRGIVWADYLKQLKANDQWHVEVY